MRRRGFSTVGSLVDDLIARHERNPDARRLVARIDDDAFVNVDMRDSFDEELAALERAGGVELVRTGTRHERRVIGALLQDVGVLYARTGRRPTGQLALEAVSELRNRPGQLPSAIGLIDAAAEAWGRGVSHIGIAAGDVGTLGQVIALATAVHDRMSGDSQEEQDFRSFSRLAVGDSKALERNIRQVAAAVARIFPDHEGASLDPEDLLAVAGLRRLPQPILLHGSLSLHDRAFPAMPYVGVPPDCVEGVVLLSKPDYVLIVENFTSFVRYVREVARFERALVAYSGGFPSRPTLATIVRLASEAGAPTFHWGDMDAGGVRIFRHLERHLMEVGIRLRPHMMNAELLRVAGAPATGERKPIADLDGSAMAGLAAFLMESGLVHEQEGFDPKSPDFRG